MIDREEATERSAAIRMWSAGRGLVYTEDDADLFVWHLPPLAFDVDHQVHDVVHGRLGDRPILSCNLYGRIPEVACAATTIAADCPPITIAHESTQHLVERHTAMLPYETELEVFNQEWEILCPDRRFATAFVDQRMIRWIMESEDGERERTFAVMDRYAVCIVPLPPLDRLTLAVDAVLGFADRVPRVVLDEYPGEAPSDPWPRTG